MVVLVFVFIKETDLNCSSLNFLLFFSFGIFFDFSGVIILYSGLFILEEEKADFWPKSINLFFLSEVFLLGESNLSNFNLSGVIFLIILGEMFSYFLNINLKRFLNINLT